MARGRRRAAELRQLVRTLPSSQLHGLAHRLRLDQEVRDPSPGAEWLFELACIELSRRAMRQPPLKRCYCELCVGPFDN